MVEIIREKHADTLAIAFSPYVRVYFDQDSDSPLRTSVTLENLTRRQVISLHNSQEDASVALIAGDGGRYAMARCILRRCRRRY